MRKMCTLITSKGTDMDENIANQNHATRTRTPKPGYLNHSIIEYWHYLPCPRITFKTDYITELPTYCDEFILLTDLSNSCNIHK
jgi:hypothetical protein